MEILTPRLRLREFTGTDYPALRDMEARNEMHTYERDMPDEKETHNRLEEFIRNQQEVPRVSFTFAITIPPKDNVRGVLKFSRLWDAIREWEIGWALHPEEWGKGYAVESALHVIDWAFKNQNIHRVVAYCHTGNDRSVRVMEKLGMHCDGRLRETRWLNGQWYDEYVYSILEKEWAKKQVLS